MGGRSWLSWIEALGTQVECTCLQVRLKELLKWRGTSLVVGVGLRSSEKRPAEEVGVSFVGAG